MNMPPNLSADLQAMYAETLRIEEDSLYSAKGQLEAAYLWGQLHLWLGVPTAVLAAAASATALKDHLTATAVLSSAVTVLAGVVTFLNPTTTAAHHHAAGTKYTALRNKARVFANVILRSSTSADLYREFHELLARREELNSGSPPIPRWAFHRARRSIESGEADYAVDKPAGADLMS